MIRSTVATLAILTAAISSGGCQNSGSGAATADTERPRMAAEAEAFSRPYTVSTDAPYMRSATDTTPAGTLRTGEVVYLREAPTGATVQARTANGRMVWVRSTDVAAR
jgi:hypothetical protein